jgi:iron complex outermembrane receptor protein
MLTSFSVAVPVTAQESGAYIEEVIVTARKRQEAAQEVPIAITAFTTELRESQIRKLSDLNGFAPNVVIGDAAGARPNGTQIQIRGVASAELSDKSHDSPIAVSIDGVFLGTTTGRNIPNFDLERIEILRGPQGTLFGKNTVGGVVNVIRSRPTGELGAKLKLTGGNDGQGEFRGVVNFPILDTLAGKVFGTRIKNDGWMRNTFTGNDGPEVDYRNYGITLLWTPTESFEAQFTISAFTSTIRTTTWPIHRSGIGRRPWN